jgi:hypothetical protein
MNTSGVDEPPEISVASVARLVSVSVDAETRVTWMFGYCFSNALMSTVRASLAPVPVSGLADQTMLAAAVEPAVLVAEAPPVAAGGVLLVLLPPLLQADTASVAAQAATVNANHPRRGIDLLHALRCDIFSPALRLEGTFPLG